MKKILIVDDSAFMRMTLKNILVENGFEIIGEAEDGKDAVRKYKELKPDIVTMDITMPGKSGIDATKDILSDHPEAVIVMVSAISQKKYVLESLRIGAKEFLFKPLNPDLVVSTIGSL